jgi:hypothetical protein
VSTSALFDHSKVFLEEMAVALAIHGKENADLREPAHKGEWGSNPTEKILGDSIVPIIFSNFKFGKGTLTIPVDAWDIDQSLSTQSDQYQATLRYLP